MMKIRRSPKAAKFGRRYPWTDWLYRPGRVVLRRGIDFDCLPVSIGVMVRMEMAKRGLVKTVRLGMDTVTIEPKSDWRGRKRDAEAAKRNS